MEFWKRKNAEIVFDWDVIGVEDDELPRPQFIGITTRKHPVTGEEIEHYPASLRLAKYLASFTTIITLVRKNKKKKKRLKKNFFLCGFLLFIYLFYLYIFFLLAHLRHHCCRCRHRLPSRCPCCFVKIEP